MDKGIAGRTAKTFGIISLNRRKRMEASMECWGTSVSTGSGRDRIPWICLLRKEEIDHNEPSETRKKISSTADLQIQLDRKFRIYLAKLSQFIQL